MDERDYAIHYTGEVQAGKLAAICGVKTWEWITDDKLRVTCLDCLVKLGEDKKESVIKK
jgi:ferredoxin-like protein FixX